MWRDPMDELIEDLERIVPPQKETFGSVYSAVEDVQFALARILRDDDEDAGDAVTPEVEAAGRQLRRAMNRLLGRDDEPTPKSLGTCSLDDGAPLGLALSHRTRSIVIPSPCERGLSFGEAAVTANGCVQLCDGRFYPIQNAEVQP